jgi:cyclase
MPAFKSLMPALACACLAAAPVCAQPAASDYDVARIADGVYTLTWKTLPISPEPNVMIVVNDDDVLVVDSSMFPSTARTIVGEIRKLTPKPVRYLVNTHWHDDHVFGNAEFRDAWPGVEIIGHVNTRTDAAEQAFGAIKQDLENSKGLLAKYEGILRAGKTDDGTPLTEERRKRVEGVIEIYKRYLKEIPGVRVALPDVTVAGDLTIHSGSRTIDIRYLGRGNTRGDLVVYLPRERVLATGDLVVEPTPFGIGSYYADWKETLAKLKAFDATTIFLAHGAAQHDWTYVTKLQQLLGDLVTRVNAEIAKGATLEQVQKTVTLDDWKKELAGEDDVKKRAFDAYFVQPAVQRQYQLAKGEAS